MRKLYRKYFEGQSPSDWDRNWNKNDITDAVDAVDKGHYFLYTPFQKYLRKGETILEGGCGLGQFVIYFSRQRFNIVGIDFAESTIKRIRQFGKTIPVHVANVLELPFADSTFDLYYSGGVVEHFEEGPERALREAHRVLKPGGILLITVPFVNLYRQVEDKILKVRTWLRHKGPLCKNRRFGSHFEDVYFLVNKMEKDKASGFHMYIYTTDEFKEILLKENFQILEYHGTNISYGLRDIDFYNKWNVRYQDQINHVRKRTPQQHSKNSSLNSLQNRQKKFRTAARNLLFWEKTTTRLGKPILKILQITFGNLILFVCTPNK